MFNHILPTMHMVASEENMRVNIAAWRVKQSERRRRGLQGRQPKPSFFSPLFAALLLQTTNDEDHVQLFFDLDFRRRKKETNWIPRFFFVKASMSLFPLFAL